ncbi:MAG: penicillin-binding transpeptidase domain-containing protein [Eubacterium sp.]
MKALSEYAKKLGLGDKTNIEIAESNSKIADEFPISAAIGQSNNNYTVVQLGRYVSSLANDGTVYDLTLLKKVTDTDGNTLETFKPNVRNEITDISSSTWQSIHKGMQLAIKEHDGIKDLKTKLAGKTGTAEADENRPNHDCLSGMPLTTILKLPLQHVLHMDMVPAMSAISWIKL